RCLLRLAPSGFAARLGRVGPVAPARFEGHVPGPGRSPAPAVRRRRCAAAPALDRLHPEAGTDRILARPAAPPARAAPVHAFASRLVEHAALPMIPSGPRQ